MHDLNRYFIELQPAEGPPVPRWRETEARRERAAHFITAIHDWLKREALEDKVAAIAMTALGQVLITCQPDVISQIRGRDEMNIAAIRRGAMLGA